MNFKTFLRCTALGLSLLGPFLESKERSICSLEKSLLSKDTFVAQMNSMSFYSQASQDKFAYGILYGLLGKQDQGYYLEIGAGEPTNINNTYFFEENFNWSGVSIDSAECFKESWSQARTNPLLVEDAIQADYSAILQSYPKVIDYLSLDIDGLYDVVLEQIPFNDHIFKVITIEHDSYRYGDIYKERERQILLSLGYHLLCSDVSNNGFSFEDWWVHPSVFPLDLLSTLESLDLQAKDHKELIQSIQGVISDYSQN